MLLINTVYTEVENFPDKIFGKFEVISCFSTSFLYIKLKISYGIPAKNISLKCLIQNFECRYSTSVSSKFFV